MLEMRLKECGAEIVQDCLMIDGIVEEAEQQTIDWAKSLG